MKQFSVVLLVAMFLVSCGDKESPEIRFITPAQNSGIDAGGQISVQVEVTDNEALSNINIGDGAITINTFDDLMKHNEIFNVTAPTEAPSGAEITVNVKATDEAGQTATDDLILIVN